ncbi:MAG: S-methyl-5-thioribose-1-phosphate isomerase [Bacillota bacterium]|nr:S-methyl-5-thioribose-1-phosphate isomerase [Bacillota bacterium]
MNNKIRHLENVALSEDGREVIIIDQTRLPGELHYIRLSSPEELYLAIFELKIRGAPAIGIFAAYGLCALAAQILNSENFHQRLREYGEYLNSSRPTAVNLSWAIQRLLAIAEAHKDRSPQDLLPLLQQEARAIHQQDVSMCRAIAEYGKSLLRENIGILTHCNAGPLATSRYGTALGPILLAHEQGMQLRVFADETRPLLQGARLTAYELQQAGVDTTLICDNMASQVMKNGWVDICFVGCDRVAMNGDTANKIGTSGVAILAKHYGIPFYVLGPSSSIDKNCQSAADIPIELRSKEEICSKYYMKPMAPAGVKCYNPAFDVTEHNLISGIITEKGIIRPPFRENLEKLMSEAEWEGPQSE